MITLPIFNIHYRSSENKPQRLVSYNPSGESAPTISATLCSHQIFPQIVFSRQGLFHNLYPVTSKKGYFYQYAPIVSTTPPNVNSTRTIPSIQVL